MQSKENAWHQMLLATGAEEVLSVKDNLGPCHKISCHRGCPEIWSNGWERFSLHLHLRLTYQDLKYKQLDFPGGAGVKISALPMQGTRV